MRRHGMRVVSLGAKRRWCKQAGASVGKSQKCALASGEGLAAFWPDMNRTDRLVALVMYFQGRRLVRAEELSKHFEVSVRTIYRDVAALSEAGVPVTGEAGVGDSLVKGYHLPPVMFTGEEALALFVGAEMVKRILKGYEIRAHDARVNDDGNATVREIADANPNIVIAKITKDAIPVKTVKQARVAKAKNKPASSAPYGMKF